MDHLSNLMLVFLLLFAGCGGIQPTNIVAPRQELISVSSLPAFGSSNMSGQLRLKTMFRVLSDGTIAEVKLLNSSGSKEWDSYAIDSMKQWLFSPSPNDTATFGHWISYSLVVLVEEPLVMTLGELAVARKQAADSMYGVLSGGVDFDSVASQWSLAKSGDRGRFLGEISIAKFPQRIRDELRKLRVHDCTQPLRRGDEYVIYLRFDHDGARNLPQ